MSGTFTVVPQSPDTVLLLSLYRFFDHPAHAKWLNVLLSHDGPSLRRIEHFIVRYARDHQVCYMVHTPPEPVWVFDAFKRYQSIYRKRNFDLYCRKKSTPLSFQGKSTTLCQLNFFRFLIETGILPCILTDPRFSDMEAKKR